MTIDFKGFTVFKNGMLPPNTLMVSPDVYEKLTETPEQRQAREHRASEAFNHLAAQMKARGLSPTGRSLRGEPNYQDMPKPNKDAPRPNIEMIR